ncbi:MAG: 3-oxoadipate enol-lactonase, partial [Dehalococcoidia bacterium]|nr:3-oxoadipate enol-lactonase [Dehalococcoidia bacterium]
MKLQTKGAVVNYEVAGQGDTLALIHGSGDNLEAWWGQTPVFSKQYQVLTFDARGQPQLPASAPQYSSSCGAGLLHGWRPGFRLRDKAPGGDQGPHHLQQRRRPGAFPHGGAATRARGAENAAD